ncbi:hypothetical protein QTI51_04100 [Variovorax sp. J22G73]|uniref:hypothetical protein n=1 Tax=unclassified Variovorax TaxID=663243 RepID=UPI002577529C|nr:MULTISPECIES: hypothetical protein [unclassified Variovorax]MDM0003889.1 hypothetical protein [Variovorax sp. J22R203]MDM0096445.1 hypothetical protein [Variovorax sp. J22G73]
MTSVVDTTVKNFNSTMTGAPALSGTAGSLISLLDAVLVNGFDLKTASGLTVAGGVASLAFTGSHSAQLDGVILIAGITGAYASLNGEQKVTAVGAGVVKFATAMADGVAAGTITFKMAPAGWEKVFAGTNKAVYRSLDPASTKMLLRVDDTGTTIARVVGYEAMTDVDTGTGSFPTAVQISGGGAWAKSSVANTTAVPWALHADARIFYFSPMVAQPTNAANLGSTTRCFGDLLAYKPGGDAYACVLNYSTQTGSPTGASDNQVFTGVGLQMAMPRSYAGLGSSLLHCTIPYIGTNTFTSGSDGALGAFPSVIDGSLLLSRRYVAQLVTAPPRGDLPGVLSSPQSQVFDVFKQLDRVPGAGAFAGRTLQVLAPTTALASASTNVNTGVGFIDITGPWR